MTDMGKPDVHRIDTLSAQMEVLIPQVGGLQSNMDQLVKSVDRLVDVSEKQVRHDYELKSNREAVDGVYKHIDGVESRLANAIDGLTHLLREDRAKNIVISDTVTGYRGGLRTLLVVGGSIITLLTVIGVMFSGRTGRDFDRVDKALYALTLRMDNRTTYIDEQFKLQAVDMQKLRSDIEYINKSNNQKAYTP